jgi:hypothetical protein
MRQMGLVISTQVIRVRRRRPSNLHTRHPQSRAWHPPSVRRTPNTEPAYSGEHCGACLWRRWGASSWLPAALPSARTEHRRVPIRKTSGKNGRFPYDAHTYGAQDKVLGASRSKYQPEWSSRDLRISLRAPSVAVGTHYPVYCFFPAQKSSTGSALLIITVTLVSLLGRPSQLRLLRVVRRLCLTKKRDRDQASVVQ